MGDRDYFRHDFGGGGGFRASFFSTIPATKTLIIGLVAIHVVMAMVLGGSPQTYRTLNEIFALQRDNALGRLWIWQFFTTGLLHAPGVWHLGWNCLMLYFFGRMVEERIGARRFWLFCVAAQLVSSIGYLVFSIVVDDIRPLVGASGYVTGLLILAACWYPHQEILLFFVLRMKLWVVAAIIVVIDYIGMFDQSSGIAHAAHLGGALYAWIYYKTGGAERLLQAADRHTEKRRRKKAQRDARREAELRAEVDRILDKVNKEGMTALTEEERRFLKQASDRLKG